MIGAVHEALRSMLYSDGKIPAGDVDITFATPTREWTAGVNRPTINFNLYAIIENTQFREVEFTRQRTGTSEAKRLRPRRIDLRYVVTTHFKSQLPEMDDQEWQVLWRVLATLMRNAEWPETMLPAEARELDVAVQAQVAAADGSPRVSEVFNSLGIPPRPALHYTLTIPLDLNVEYLNSLVVAVDLGVRDLGTGQSLSDRRRYAWRLLDKEGLPLPGVEIRLPDAPGYSLSTEAGHFTTLQPHAEVKQMLVRRPGTADWEVVKVKKGEYDVVLK